MKINFLLHKKYRLQSYLIPEVVKKGKRFYSKSFILITNHQSLTTNHQSSRFAFIVSKKFDKRAVKRNKFKRWMKEAVRADLIKIKKGYNIILIAHQYGRKNNFIQIKIELRRFLNKAELLK